jgi:hypothetical protein
MPDPSALERADSIRTLMSWPSRAEVIPATDGEPAACAAVAGRPWGSGPFGPRRRGRGRRS